MGCSVEARSRSARLGWRLSVSSVSSYPMPTTQSPFEVPAALSRRRSTMVSTLSMSPIGGLFKSRSTAKMPAPGKWAWASMKPGSRAFPCRSTMRLCWPARSRISASLPTAAIRSPSTRSASTTRFEASMVRIGPPRYSTRLEFRRKSRDNDAGARTMNTFPGKARFVMVGDSIAPARGSIHREQGARTQGGVT